MIRVMLVDDSTFMRNLTKTMIMESGEIVVVEEAKNGEEALQKISNNVDVVLLDIEMPKMNGLQVLEEWNKNNRLLPTIMFSSLTKNGADETLRALDLGAFDFIEKPSNPVLLNKKKEELINKIRFASKQRKIKKTSVTKSSTLDPFKNTKNEAPRNVKNLILIGCSTGGPKALKEIIPMFPGDLNAAILVVQHMPKGGYTKSLADSLNRASQLSVCEAIDGQKIKNGNVYIAPGGYQMKINVGGNIVITENEPENGHAPSVDYMFREVLNKKGNYNLIPVVLTGMGGDGSKGSLILSNNGIKTIIESEETCIVFGMPKKVIEIGAKHTVAKLENIASEIQKCIK